MIDSPHLHPFDARAQRAHARREKKLVGLFGLPKQQQQKQAENLVPLSKVWTDKDGAQMIQAYRTKFAIVYQYAPPHLLLNFQPPRQAWHVFAIDRSSTPGQEVLSLLLSVQESLDGAIAIAGTVDGRTS